jgi:glycosyltransferase involved in cell wall biosynthesis
MLDQAVLGSPRLLWVVPHSITKTLYATARREPSRALHALGWQVTLVATGEDEQLDLDGVVVYQLKVPNVYFLRQMLFHFRVISLILREWDTVDVVLFHQISAIWLLTLKLWGRVTRKKWPLFVLDTRDFPDYVPGNLKLRLRKLYYQLIYWVADRWADGQTAITNRMAELVNIPEDQLLGVWPSGVKLETFQPAQSLRSWPEPQEPVQLIYIGSLVEKRNLLPLCRAVEKANQEGMAFQLLLVGSGRYQNILDAYSCETEGRITVMPSVPHEQIPNLLAQAHVGVTSLPDPDEQKYQASSPIKLFEYMAAGMPILAIRSVCHTDVAGNDPYVIWADQPTEASLLKSLRKLWEQSADLTRLGEQAGSAAGNWTWQASAQKLSNALLHGLKNGHN